MKRLPTMVPGLDEILTGGLFEGGVYILEGPPGVGKTTLANQLAYTHARKGVKTLYVTMLAESHARMLQHMEGQSFFRRDAVNVDVFYMSGYRDLERHGLKAVVDLVRGELVRSGASILVVDGLVVGSDSGGADEGLRRFVHELQSLAAAMTCTCLLLTSGRGSMHSAEQTMVDGIFAFEDHAFRWRSERCIRIRKFRGSEVVRGTHTFCITADGLKFFPRLESLPWTVGAAAPVERGALSTGVPALDGVLQAAGFAAGTNCALVGDSGTGKTTLAIAFAAAGTLAGPSLFMGAAESTWELERLGVEVDVPVKAQLESGALTVERLDNGDESLDEMGHKILRLVDELKVKRLAVDGLAALADTLAFPDRGYRFVGRLLNELKRRGVTSFITIDPAALATAAGSSLAPGVLAWFDNVLQLSELPQDAGCRNVRLKKLRAARGGDLHVDVTFPRR